ncbi:hypothetical protein PGUG_01954 [Meyerozyma guilliermondii ATCC 6260]|uniref:Uncharacterized protein n=1 Tax=Meyerozyma guilliermondii (strain ATCC 6260 / CBS 566 / DSM 6381 / JCM 1539 / NBRC 10279 / NRRL Y-324) TaxID=294746 RepID=A5DFA3_PICGU|nr:uncharacterized protein PGUG_01954 [Meyerozyma guilliermondii ATCC 6260]EDK37856.2 hypothetical protein PGUG_01954 [Meyerozyma guilliermondii ATCC 6260]
MGGRPRGFMRKRFRRIPKNFRPTKSRIDRKSPIVPNLAAVQGSNGLFQDSSEIATFDWPRLAPTSYDYRGPCGVLEPKLVSLKSLKAICANKVARNIEFIASSSIHEIPWSALSEVWKQCLKLNTDSPRVFSMFAQKFYKQKDFKCHNQKLKSNNEVAKIRHEAIEYHKLPNSRKHRIEIVYSNVRIRDTVSYSFKLETCSWIILDLTSFKASKDDMLSVLNFQNLVCLDLSYSAIDDSFVYSLASSILREGKLSKLTIIRLVNCKNVTIDGIKSLMNIKNRASFSLSCIESDLELNKDNSSYVHDNWFVTSDNHMSSLPLTLKLQYLFKNYGPHILAESSSKDITTNPVYLSWSKDFILLDLSYVDVALDSQFNTDAMVSGWTKRKNANHNSKPCFTYVVDNRTRVKSEPLSQLARPSSSRHVPKIQRNRIKSDVKSFFDL